MARAIPQSFTLSPEQVEAVEQMMKITGMQKGRLFRHALGVLAKELEVEWPPDPKPGRPWPSKKP